MDEQSRQLSETTDAVDSELAKPLSRRALLKGTARAMPAVLTLQSGAALARSSNLIGAASPYTRDLDGNTLCLDTSTVYPLPDGTKYDLGEPAMASVNVITDREFFYEENKSSAAFTGDMCADGGPYFFHEGGWQEVRLPANGVVVSATSLVSLSVRGDILFNRIG